MLKPGKATKNRLAVDARDHKPVRLIINVEIAG